MRSLVLLLPCVGYVSVVESFGDTVPARGVSYVQMRTSDGSLQYEGRATSDSFLVDGRSYASGSSRNRVTGHEADNEYAVWIEDGALYASADAYDRGGVDFDITGPSLVDTDLVTAGGVRLENVEGIHWAEGSSITARDVVGDVDFRSYGGMDVQILPYTDVGYVNIVSEGGDVAIGLPWGLDYDLRVIGDPDYVMVVDDLGFDSFLAATASVAAWRGFATVQITVDVIGGDVDIYPL